MTNRITLNADVIIVGGGLVGLVLGLALAQNDFHVIIIENKTPVLSSEDKYPVARVSAINLSTKKILANLDLWSKMPNDSYSSLQQLVVWDSLGAGKVEFDAADLGVAELGHIIENRQLIKLAWQELSRHPRAQLLNGEPIHLQRHEDSITVELSDGHHLQAELCVGADGADSWLRQQMNTTVKERSYQQQAIIAVVTTEFEHQNTGWQVFLPTGPLAFLPLKDKNICAIVWSTDSKRSLQLMSMTEAEFECELNNAFGLSLGEIKYQRDRQAFPLVRRHVSHYVEPHLVLVGDAAHTIHPLAGQGVNLGFMDAACLVDCLVGARQKRQSIGAFSVLRRYERWRKGDNAEMIFAMQILKDLFASESSLIVPLRSFGFNCVNRWDRLKKQIMQQAVGHKKDLPSLAQEFCKFKDN